MVRRGLLSRADAEEPPLHKRRRNQSGESVPYDYTTQLQLGGVFTQPHDAQRDVPFTRLSSIFFFFL